MMSYRPAVKFRVRLKQLDNIFLLSRLSSTVIHTREMDLATKLNIETKWARHVDRPVKFNENSPSEKYYVLSMFPYPSGNLHMGHVRVYTISDTVARFHRLNGKNVLHPIGFDSFGLPAENAAFENGVDPQEWTERNIVTMRRQLKRLKCSFDWDREVITSKPEYYKFTQQLFIMLFNQGLAYRKKSFVNWDPVDKTVLADEQVDANGRSWRSGALIEKKLLHQWFIRTTKYAQSLWNGLNDPSLQDWRDITSLQKHWIGECDGADFEFPVFQNGKKIGSETIWLRHPEHISKAAFVAFNDNSIMRTYLGSGLDDVYTINPFTNTRLPIFLANELVYPTGCDVKLGIPCKCESDEDFAKSKNLKFDSTPSNENFEERYRICKLAIEAKIGGHPKSSKLRDWLISRQRYWGTPIPIIHCPNCGPVPVPQNELPVILPDRGNLEDFKKTQCPQCGNSATRETDTMDTFVDSSWYYLRYIDPGNSKEPFTKEKLDRLMPVDLYIGGKEHATLHLYYARFVSHFLHDMGFLKSPEPFQRLLVQGMVLGRTYYEKGTGKCLKSSEVSIVDGQSVETLTGMPVEEKWEKMSKSKHNGVEPSDMFDRYGVDTTRLLILAEVAPTSNRQWKIEAFDGVLNFQNKIWSTVLQFSECRSSITSTLSDDELAKQNESLFDTRNYHVKGATFNFGISYQFSVALSKLQSLVKSLRRCSPQVMAQSREFEKSLGALIIMLAPMAPHFASELWHRFASTPRRIDTDNAVFNWERPVLEQKWPELDDSYELEIFIKVNNAVKERVKLPYGRIVALTESEAFELAMKRNKILEFISGRDVLECEYRLVDKYQAILNIVIDHLQPKKLKASQ